VVHGEQVKVGLGVAREVLEHAAGADRRDHRAVDRPAPGGDGLGPGDVPLLFEAEKIAVHLDVLDQARVGVDVRGGELLGDLRLVGRGRNRRVRSRRMREASDGVRRKRPSQEPAPALDRLGPIVRATEADGACRPQ
jgi:hypothetical protein